MRRIVLCLIVAGGLALMAAPMANAQVECGHSYAMQITGGQDSTLQNGPVTAVVGIGSITFGAGCTGKPTGELILNSGDMQFNPVSYAPTGEMFGPASCYAGSYALAAGGIACFDGTDHITSGALTTPGPNADGSQDLTVTFSGEAWNVDSFSPPFSPSTYGPLAGTVSLEFTLQPASATQYVVVGTSVPGTTTPYASALTLTMQEIRTTPVPTIWGALPYEGTSAISCSGFGANQTDPVSSAQDPPSIASAYGSTAGSLSIWSGGFSWGSLSMNDNDEYQTSGSISNSDCAFVEVPSTSIAGGPAAYAYADGTSNGDAVIASPAADPNCTDAATAGAGYTTSNVQWGLGDTDEYVTLTGITSDATGFTPPGQMATCTLYNQGTATGKLLVTNSPATVATTCDPAPDADCPVTAHSVITANNTISGEAANNAPYCAAILTLPTTTGALATKTVAGPHPYVSTAQCTISLTGSPLTYAPIFSPSVGPISGVNCSCTEANVSGTVLAYPVASASATLTATSPDCPMAPYTTVVKCEN